MSDRMFSFAARGQNRRILLVSHLRCLVAFLFLRFAKSLKWNKKIYLSKQVIDKPRLRQARHARRHLTTIQSGFLSQSPWAACCWQYGSPFRFTQAGPHTYTQTGALSIKHLLPLRRNTLYNIRLLGLDRTQAIQQLQERIKWWTVISSESFRPK